ncbi:MAG: hypothetical protein EZS28_045711 [Streblomastix strix]|uniref:Uncharacterized protein n=1 Tax=Streblomastix strix TaxID=222440 RepID=A0A5J4TLX6_9EUKA|nr:MAG: hypothetical protein EZS28_045711 [Streblomastix strix]
MKCETLEKGPKRKYTRKSKTDENAKAMIDLMINEQTNVLTIELTNRQIIEEKYDEHIYDLINSEGDLETRISNQQLTYRYEKNRDDNTFLEMIQPLSELCRDGQFNGSPISSGPFGNLKIKEWSKSLRRKWVTIIFFWT